MKSLDSTSSPEDLIERFADFAYDFCGPAQPGDIPSLRRIGKESGYSIRAIDQLPVTVVSIYETLRNWPILPESPQDHLVVPEVFPDGRCGVPPGSNKICLLQGDQGLWIIAIEKADGETWQAFMSSEDYKQWIPMKASPEDVLLTYIFTEATTFGPIASKPNDYPDHVMGIPEEELEGILSTFERSPFCIYTGLDEKWALMEPDDFEVRRPRFLYHEDARILWLDRNG